MPEYSGPETIRIAESQITETVRVTTRAIRKAEWFGSYWKIETWVFSEDPRIKKYQKIHFGSHASIDREAAKNAMEIHENIEKNVRHRLLLDKDLTR